MFVVVGGCTGLRTEYALRLLSGRVSSDYSDSAVLAVLAKAIPFRYTLTLFGAEVTLRLPLGNSGIEGPFCPLIFDTTAAALQRDQRVGLDRAEEFWILKEEIVCVCHTPEIVSEGV